MWMATTEKAAYSFVPCSASVQAGPHRSHYVKLNPAYRLWFFTKCCNTSHRCVLFSLWFAHVWGKIRFAFSNLACLGGSRCVIMLMCPFHIHKKVKLSCIFANTRIMRSTREQLISLDENRMQTTTLRNTTKVRQQHWMRPKQASREWLFHI